MADIVLVMLAYTVKSAARLLSACFTSPVPYPWAHVHSGLAAVQLLGLDGVRRSPAGAGVVVEELCVVRVEPLVEPNRRRRQRQASELAVYEDVLCAVRKRVVASRVRGGDAAIPGTDAP